MARLSHCDKILVLLFVLSLPLVNPWVRGDGVGYYAFGRAVLIQHNLDFRQDWLRANSTFRMGRTDAAGNILSEEYTATGHIDNHFSVGPAILWSPFLLAAHLCVLSYDALGGHIPSNGFAKPYIVSMALATAFYGFLSVWISFRLARKYLPERYALLATVGIWFASSLPIYMYFNPSWSHPLSAFIVALFVWYWDRTRGSRSWPEWIVLGAIGGLMMDVYPPNATLLLFPALEYLAVCWQRLARRDWKSLGWELSQNGAFVFVLFVAFLPTLVAKKIIYGSYFNFGYAESWFLNSPAFLKVCFSPDHGLFSWTPIIVPAVIGMWLLRKRDEILALYSIIVFFGFLYLIGCYQDWDGLSSFGNRFFVSLTILFVLGLGGFINRFAYVWSERRAWRVAQAITLLLVIWNFGLIFQWGTHLIPARGPISWRQAAYNQVVVVPVQIAGTLKRYVTHRGQLMRNIEEDDVEHIKPRPDGSE